MYIYIIHICIDIQTQSQFGLFQVLFLPRPLLAGTSSLPQSRPSAGKLKHCCKKGQKEEGMVAIIITTINNSNNNNNHNYNHNNEKHFYTSTLTLASTDARM